MPTIAPVVTRRDIDRFVEVPFDLYQHHGRWVPPLRRDERRRFSRTHNAFLQHASIAAWIATDGGRDCGRIAAVDDPRHNERHQERVTWFGFFEAADAGAAQALLTTVERHALDRGSVVVRGPVNPSLNESGGLLIDGFDRDPSVLMPYNPPWYADAIEQAGFRKTKDLWAWRIDLTVPIGERIAAAADRARERYRITVRPIDLAAFERDLAAIVEVYRAAWTDNWGFVPPTDAEVRQLARELKPIIDPELVLLALQDGTPVGCAVAIPDVNPVLKRMRGRLFPFGLFHFVRRRSLVDAARLLLLGVVPRLRRVGLYPVLIAEIHRRAVARGYRRGEMSWTLEDNDAVNAGIVAAGGVRDKTYRLYEKRIG